jgi:hypothetical protein
MALAIRLVLSERVGLKPRETLRGARTRVLGGGRRQPAAAKVGLRSGPVIETVGVAAQLRSGQIEVKAAWLAPFTATV